MSAVGTARQKRDPVSKDYGYCNARVRGMKSRLLGLAFFERLMEAAEINRTIQLLTETEYASDVDDAIIKGRTPASIDEALRQNMVRTFQKVMRFLNPEAQDLIGTLLGRWDLFNIKSIVRGKHIHVSPEEIEDGLYAVGTLSPIDLRLLASLESVRAVTDTLVTWGSPYAAPLRANMAAYEQDGNLAIVELALDRHYSQWASKRLVGRGVNVKLALRILGLQIDSVNLLTAFRLLKSDIGDMEPAMFFLTGGAHIGKDLFVQLAGLSDVDEVLDKLQRTPYGSQLESVVVRYVEEGSLSVFERALEDYVMRRALASGRGDPLGVGVVISYLWAKQNEVTNLRIIVKGNAVGMPADRMRKELILV